ncbi:Hsp20/alpha crystallin family protein [Paludifilum halophilum]|uniref:Hsp20/alpha crystallin family protein n=1 Tax=Paludifilum halophilum TaxID=1642702 RepID=UPI00146D296E|nr:Hsp20/alpha crystallin family protein [Paludifilum halophilum]
MKRNQFTQWGRLARDFLGEDFWSEVSGAVQGYPPRVDVLKNEREVIVLIDAPGIDDIDTVELHVDEETLYVRGEISPSRQDCQRILTERFQGQFERVVPLGETVSRENTRARYRKGVLEIYLPKGSTARNERRIRVEQD